MPEMQQLQQYIDVNLTMFDMETFFKWNKWKRQDSTLLKFWDHTIGFNTLIWNGWMRAVSRKMHCVVWRVTKQMHCFVLVNEILKSVCTKLEDVIIIIINIMHEYYLGAVKSKRTARAPYKIKINMSCGVG